MVGLFFIVNVLVYEFEIVWTVILRCKVMTYLRNGKFIVIFMDEGLYRERYKCLRMLLLCLEVFICR